MILCGRYSGRVGVWHTIMGRSILPRGEVTMAETFLSNGYRTGIFGQWQLGDNFPFRAQDRGFQESLVFGGGAIGNLPDYWDNDYFDNHYCRNGRWEKYSGYCQDVFFQAAMDFMAGTDGRPFFCYLPTNVAHWPRNVAEDYVRPYRGLVPVRRATLYGMIANLDKNIGKIREFLRQKGLEENTLVIFMSDNETGFGAEFDKNGFVTAGENAGMRGDKSSVYEGGHRVPCFIRWPRGGIIEGRDIPPAHRPYRPSADAASPVRPGKAGRRFPQEADLPLCGGPQGYKEFNPTQARLKIGDIDETRPIREGDKAVTFPLQPVRQRTRLQAWLVDDIENGETNGAYYVYVKRMD